VSQKGADGYDVSSSGNLARQRHTRAHTKCLIEVEEFLAADLTSKVQLADDATFVA
jgi:hypothetical protein